MPITPWEEQTQFLFHVIFKKKVSCFTFSFVYEKIRKSMKKWGPGKSRGVLSFQKGSGRGLERPGESQGLPNLFFYRFFTASGTPGGFSRGAPWEVFSCIFYFFEASMRHACWDRFFIDFWSLKACKIEGLSRRKSLICLEKTEGFIRIMIFLRRCVKTRCQVAMRAVLGGFKRPPGNGFGNEIDFQSLFLTNKIY